MFQLLEAEQFATRDDAVTFLTGRGLSTMLNVIVECSAEDLPEALRSDASYGALNLASDLASLVRAVVSDPPEDDWFVEQWDRAVGLKQERKALRHTLLAVILHSETLWTDEQKAEMDPYLA